MKNQTYIWWSAENPISLSNELSVQFTDFQAFDGFFNKTMSYRQDSDIYWPYGSTSKLLRKLSRGKKAVDDILLKKSNLAVSIFTNLFLIFSIKI